MATLSKTAKAATKQATSSVVGTCGCGGDLVWMRAVEAA